MDQSSKMSKINYFEVEGDPEDIGLAHGRQFGDKIAEGLTEWDAMLREQAKIGRYGFVKSFLEQTNYKPRIQQFSPEALAEINAIAKGAEQDPELIFAWQLVDEWLDFAIENYLVAKCSALGAYDQGPDLPPIIGKTQDLPHLYIGKSVLIRTKTRFGEYLNSGVAGIICQDGLNDRGVGVCCNHVGHLERDPSGIPTAVLLHNMISKANSVDEAVEIAGSVPSASGMNYVIGDTSKVRDIEVSAHHVEEYDGRSELKRFWHTNHPLANTHYVEDIDLWHAMSDKEGGNTQARLDSLEKNLCRPDTPLDLGRAKAALSSRDGPVSSLPEDDFPTVNGLIIEHFDDPVLHFCAGAPSKGIWKEFRFD